MGKSVITRSKAFLRPLFKTVTAASPPWVTAITVKPASIIKDQIYVKIVIHPLNMNNLKTTCDEMAKVVLNGRNLVDF